MGRIKALHILEIASVIVQDSDGWTALMQAVSFNSFEIVQELVRAGAALDLQNNKGITALMNANRLEIVQELIRAGAALDLQDKRGNTALMRAVMNNHLKIVQELIRVGAALDVQDKNGRTALMISADHESGGAIAAMLVEAGARCPGYKRSGVFNSKCKFCRESKKRHRHSRTVTHKAKHS